MSTQETSLFLVRPRNKIKSSCYDLLCRQQKFNRADGNTESIDQTIKYLDENDYFFFGVGSKNKGEQKQEFEGTVAREKFSN